MYTTVRLLLALKLVELSRNKWGVLTDDNKLVIITSDRRIAKGYMQWLMTMT